MCCFQGLKGLNKEVIITMRIIKIAMPKKTKLDLKKRKGYIEVEDDSFEETGELSVIIYDYIDETRSYVEIGNLFISKTTSDDSRWKDTYYVVDANAQKGWGPLMYDTAMDYLTKKKKHLIPNSEATSRGIDLHGGGTSSKARNVWRHYDEKRDDVTKTESGYQKNEDPNDDGSHIGRPINLDYWENYAKTTPYQPEKIPESILQHPRIQNALKSIPSWVEVLKLLYYRIDDCPESIRNHPDIQNAYMYGLKRGLITSPSVYEFYTKLKELPEQLKTDDFFKEIEVTYWDKILSSDPSLYRFGEHLHRVRENPEILNVLYRLMEKERVDKFLERFAQTKTKIIRIGLIYQNQGVNQANLGGS